MDRQIEGVISQTRIQNVRKRLISKLSKELGLPRHFLEIRKLLF